MGNLKMDELNMELTPEQKYTIIEYEIYKDVFITANSKARILEIKDVWENIDEIEKWENLRIKTNQTKKDLIDMKTKVLQLLKVFFNQ